MGRQTRVGAAVFIALIVGFGLGVWASNVVGREPSFTCSTPDGRACSNTEASMRGDMRLVFAEPLPARLVSVDVRPAPSEWKSRGTYDEGDWAAFLTLEDRDPMLVLCYYSSDEMVGCQLP